MIKLGGVAYHSALALILTGGMMGAAAQAETKLGADVAVTGGVATNPYGGAQSSVTVGTLSGSFSPNLTILTPSGTTNIGASIMRTDYSSTFTGSTDYSVNASSSQKLSDLTSFSFGAGFSSNIRNALYPVVDPSLPIVIDPTAPIIVDPSATVTFADRTETISGQAGFSTTLSPLDSLSVSANASRVTFRNLFATGARNYDSYGTGLSFMHQVAADTSIGLSFNASRSNYRQTNIGDGTQLSPNLVLNTNLGPRVVLNASAGVTFSDTDLGFIKQKTTSFSGSFSLCRNGDRSHYCLDGSQRVAPTALQGNSKVTAFGLSYGYTIDDLSDIGAHVSYSRAQELTALTSTNVKTDYTSANISYNRKIRDRLSLIISATYSDSYDSSFDIAANYAGSIGVRYRLGE